MALSKQAQNYIAWVRKHDLKALFTNREAFAQALEENRTLQQKPYQAPGFIYEAADVELTTTPSGFDAYTLTPKGREGSSAPARHVLYFHGGAFFLQIDKGHWDYCLRLVEECDATVTVPIYPLAPTYDFTIAYEYLLEIYQWVLGRTPANKVVLMGDSAGGFYDIVLAQLACLHGLEQPALLMPFSPVIELRPPDPATIDQDLEERDILLSYSASDLINDIFIRDNSYLEAFPANPILGPVEGLAPLVIYAGGDEIFSRDALRFAEKVAAAGGEAEVHIIEGMWHIFPLTPNIPESEKVNEQVFARLREVY